MLELREFVVSANKLFTIPDICLSLNELVTQHTCSVTDISRVVGHDPALTVRVLRLANSPIYSRGGTISSLDQAILKIGTDELCNIALATAAALVFKGAGESRINLKDYWNHSVYSAVLAQRIYSQCFKQRGGSMFIAGLLHNLGLLVVLERLPYLAIDLEDVIGPHKRATNFERDKLGFTLTEVASELLYHWRLAPQLISLVRNQHLSDPDSQSVEGHFSLYCAIKIADVLYATQAPLSADQILSEQEINRLQLTPETFDELIEHATANVASVIDIIQG